MYLVETSQKQDSGRLSESNDTARIMDNSENKVSDSLVLAELDQ